MRKNILCLLKDCVKNKGRDPDEDVLNVFALVANTFPVNCSNLSDRNYDSDLEQAIHDIIALKKSPAFKQDTMKLFRKKSDDAMAGEKIGLGNRLAQLHKAISGELDESAVSPNVFKRHEAIKKAKKEDRLSKDVNDEDFIDEVNIRLKTIKESYSKKSARDAGFDLIEKISSIAKSRKSEKILHDCSGLFAARAEQFSDNKEAVTKLMLMEEAEKLLRCAAQVNKTAVASLYVATQNKQRLA